MCAVSITDPSFFMSILGTWCRNTPSLNRSHSSAYATVSRVTVWTPMSTSLLGAALAVESGGPTASGTSPLPVSFLVEAFGDGVPYSASS